MKYLDLMALDPSKPVIFWDVHRALNSQNKQGSCIINTLFLEDIQHYDYIFFSFTLYLVCISKTFKSRQYVLCMNT